MLHSRKVWQHFSCLFLAEHFVDFLRIVVIVYLQIFRIIIIIVCLFCQSKCLHFSSCGCKCPWEGASWLLRSCCKKTKILKFDSTFGVNLIAYGVFIQYHLIISCNSEPLKPWPKNFATFRFLPFCHNMREFWQSQSARRVTAVIFQTTAWQVTKN